MDQNIPLAVLIQTVGSFFFALSAYLQHDSVTSETDGNLAKERIDFSTLWESIKSPRWLIGLLVMGLSLGCQVLALRMAPVSVVQPVGVLAFPWSMLIQSKLQKVPITKPVQYATITTIVAIMGFVLVSSLFAAQGELNVIRVFIGALVIYLCAMALGALGTRGPKAWRSLFWASGGAFFYGLEAALVKALLEYAKAHDWLHDAAFWGMTAALVIGSVTAGWMVQQGYGTGAAEIVVAAMTITSPVVAVLFGVLVLGEGDRLTNGATAIMVILGMVAVGGIVALTLLHPTNDGRRHLPVGDVGRQPPSAP